MFLTLTILTGNRTQEVSEDQNSQYNFSPCKNKKTEQSPASNLWLDNKRFPIKNISIGHYHESTQPDALKEALTEFISTFIIVFAHEGSGMAFAKVTDSAANIRARLIVAAIAHAFSLFVFVSVAANISKK